MNTAAATKFLTEAKRLRSLYVVSSHAFGALDQRLHAEVAAGTRKLREPIDLSWPTGTVQVPTGHELLNKLSSQYPRYLRDALYVRLVSALEVFFVDSIRELFLARRDLFQAQDRRIEFTHAELLSTATLTQLWTKLLNQELRQLQNQGFKEIAKYLKRRCQIDIAGSGINFSTLVEFHDRRHLLVHRLGSTDAKYRHAYRTTETRLAVSAEYLLTSIETFENLVRYVDTQAGAAISGAPQGQDSRSGEIVRRITVKVLAPEANPYLTAEFSFAHQDQIHDLRAIRRDVSIQGRTTTITLSGSRSVVNAYIKILRSQARNGALRILQNDVEYARAVCRLPANVVGQISEAIAAGTVLANYKDIASHFGVPRKDARAALAVIIQKQFGKSAERSAARDD